MVLSPKEQAFLQALKQMVGVMEKDDICIMPEPCEAFSTVKGSDDSNLFFIEDKVVNPITWIKEICSMFGQMLAGEPQILKGEAIFVKNFDIEEVEVELFDADTAVEIIEEFAGQKVVLHESDSDETKFLVQVNTKLNVVTGNKLGEEYVQPLSGASYPFKVVDMVDEEDDFEDEVDAMTFKSKVDVFGVPHDAEFEDEDNSDGVATQSTKKDFDKVVKEAIDEDRHGKIAKDVASLVSEKQKAYGNSVDKVERVIEVLMEQYDNGDGTYTIPKELIPHLLYQVRILDKQNRVFTNPQGDLMDESPYKDILGYALLMLAKQEKE